MLGFNGLDDLIPMMDYRIRRARERQTALAEVTAKDGTGVYVKRFGSVSQEGPYPSIASGVLQVGQMVELLNADKLPVVGWPIETTQRSNYMTLVGADMDVDETTSHTDYE